MYNVQVVLSTNWRYFFEGLIGQFFALAAVQLVYVLSILFVDVFKGMAAV